MEKATLEAIAQRLDRLEKMVVEVNEKLSWLIEELVPDPPKDCEHTGAVSVLSGESNKQDAILPRKLWTEYLKKWAFHLILIPVLLRSCIKV